MKHIRLFLVLGIAVVLSGCGLFGGSDGGTETTTADSFESEPTVTNVQQLPLNTPEADTSTEPTAVAQADAALPTAVTIPPTAVPPTPTPDRSQPSSYVVQSGDVLGLIAERFDISVADLRLANGLTTNFITVGQTLTIPALDGSTEAPAGDGETASPAPAPTAVPAPVSCSGVGYCVQPGDTLSGIASSNGTTVEALQAANPALAGGTSIVSGQLLNLPGTTAPPTTDTPSTDTPSTDTPSTDTPSTDTPTGETPTVDIPTSDADCRAVWGDQYPYYHDGACHANPFSDTETTDDPPDDDATEDVTCPEDRFLWEDGLCYPIPGLTVTPDPAVTPEAPTGDDVYIYGDGPDCPTNFVVLLSNNKCWPNDQATEQQKQDAADAAAASS